MNQPGIGFRVVAPAAVSRTQAETLMVARVSADHGSLQRTRLTRRRRQAQRLWDRGAGSETGGDTARRGHRECRRTRRLVASHGILS